MKKLFILALLFGARAPLIANDPAQAAAHAAELAAQADAEENPLIPDPAGFVHDAEAEAAEFAHQQQVAHDVTALEGQLTHLRNQLDADDLTPAVRQNLTGQLAETRDAALELHNELQVDPRISMHTIQRLTRISQEAAALIAAQAEEGELEGPALPPVAPHIDFADIAPALAVLAAPVFAVLGAGATGGSACKK